MMNVTVSGTVYDVEIVYGEHPDLEEEDVGSFLPVKRKILVRYGAPKGTYEHEEFHAMFYACGLDELLRMDIRPRKKLEEVMICMLTPVSMSVVRNEELKAWLAD